MEQNLNGIFYVVQRNITAMKSRPGDGARFMTIPRGAVIALNDIFKDFGLLEFQYAGETVSVFSRDISEGAERLR